SGWRSSRRRGDNKALSCWFPSRFSMSRTGALKARATINVKNGAVHVAIGHQEQHGAGGLVDAAPSLERMAFRDRAHVGLALVTHCLANQRRVDRARR